ncbi:MAG: glycosyltransferase family 4 protein [Pseudomonadota bacterium]
MKLLYVVNEAQFFLSHRLPLGLEALARGCEVVVVTAPGTGEERLAQYGFRHIPVEMSRSDFQLMSELRTYRQLCEVYRAEQPDLVHHVTIKPVVYGSFAARAAGVAAVVNAVPGMGFVFSRGGVLAAVRRFFVNLLYRLALAPTNMRVIFQNSEDMRSFINHGIVPRERTVLIRGAGVDLQEFVNTSEPDGPVTFVLPSRMIRDKGVVRFALAAGSLRRDFPEWRFWLAGGVDPGNPAALSEQELRDLEMRYGVTWLGHRDNMAQVIRDCHVVCLPTSYREGLPKVLLEAAASGRAMVASNIAGCREVVTEGVTGLLVEAEDVEELRQAMQRLGEDPGLRERCAAAARMKAEAVFSVADVVEHTFRVYDELQAS